MSDDITLIDELYIQPFYRCNIWHVRGCDRDMLVDSGMGVVSLREHVPLVNEKDVIAVASHTHFDHIGNHREFEERWVHEAEAHILAHPTRGNTLAEPFVSDDIFDSLPPRPYRSTEYAVKPAAATRLLKDADVIDLGDRQFFVIHTPGHSPGGIALYEEASRTLISGDVIYDGPLISDLYHSDMQAYISSMKLLLDMEVQTVHGGHFASFGGERLKEIARNFLSEHDK
ncbi:MBL fold metallo-hydrolase [Flexibacterium corallicola]|uniref:MBL fold metallo-hydrolase n=1 Tax=Flexibacterium corallicola TaxID=3037259 RepID=UPI00286F5D6D|nr:MBL fold metallo-hydrolase [Pseudovibrio sp. M1P-2-3]